MEIEEVRQCLANCWFTDHARREMEGEPFGAILVEEVLVEEVLQAFEIGEIIEEYPEDKAYPSCLVCGRTAARRPIHIVCAPVPTERRLIITTYHPDPRRWDQDFRRRREP